MTPIDDETQDKNDQSHYKIGLNPYKESVISAHFMGAFIRDKNLSLYKNEIFNSRSIAISPEDCSDILIPTLRLASQDFVENRLKAVRKRAKKNYHLYELSADVEVGLSETIAEVMFDRQFLKGPKVNYSRVELATHIQKCIDEQSPIQMIIPALPYKVNSPFKCRTVNPDLGEVGFILGLAEIAEVIHTLYLEAFPSSGKFLARFTIVSDGLRFNDLCHEDQETILKYQEQLKLWIRELKVEGFVEVVDYKESLKLHMPQDLLTKKDIIKNHTIERYNTLMLPLFDVNQLQTSVQKAIAADPDFEKSQVEGRFVPLFKSLLYTVHYKGLSQYAHSSNSEYNELYSDLIAKVYEPLLVLSSDEAQEVERYLLGLPGISKPADIQIFEVLRQSMLREAWQAAIYYIAEIKSDRDLPQEPISTCFPDHVRWTIHSKPGQLAVLIPTAFGRSIQPWHGVAFLKKSHKNKVKFYTLPVLYLEGIGATPLVSSLNPKSPLCYIDPELNIKSVSDFLECLALHLTRQRKS